MGIVTWISAVCLAGCPSDLTQKKNEQVSRLRIVNGCSDPMWIFWYNSEGGGDSGTPKKFILDAGKPYLDVQIPDAGFAGSRFWPGYNCDPEGNGCQIGQSGGPAKYGFTCPPEGCAPPVDSKFEGTFGCLSTVDPSLCQINPSGAPGQRLPTADSWDTSMVDGYTLPYKVRVLDDCIGGPNNNAIDCSNLSMSSCPDNEDLSSGGIHPEYSSMELNVSNPSTGKKAGCFSDCGRLTYNNWKYEPGLNPSDLPAVDYCCPVSEISPESCRKGPVANTSYVDLIHQQCPQVYAYSYDETNPSGALWSCPAGTRYEVTFYCPNF